VIQFVNTLVLMLPSGVQETLTLM